MRQDDFNYFNPLDSLNVEEFVVYHVTKKVYFTSNVINLTVHFQNSSAVASPCAQTNKSMLNLVNISTYSSKVMQMPYTSCCETNALSSEGETVIRSQTK